MLFFRNVGKAKGETEGCHWNNSSFILIPVCFLFASLVFVCLFVFALFLSLSVYFLLLHLREQLQYGWNIVSCLFLFAFVCLMQICTIISAPIENFFKGCRSRPSPFSCCNKQLQCYNEMVSHLIVERKVNHTYTEGKKNILPSNTYTCMHR